MRPDVGEANVRQTPEVIMIKVQFVSVVPTHLPTHYLAFRQLHGYALSQGLKDEFVPEYRLVPLDHDVDRLVADILRSDPDLVCFSVHIWNLDHIREFCRRFIARPSRIRLVLGGPMADFEAESWVRDSGVDAVVRGPGEDAFADIIRGFRNGTLCWSAIPNVVYRAADLTVAATELRDVDVTAMTYDLPVDDGEDEFFLYETSRGCVFNCRYCAWSANARKQLRFFPIAKIERDMTAIFNLRRILHLGFSDADLFVNKEHGIQVLRLINRLNTIREARGWPIIRLVSEVNPELVDDMVIGEIAQSPGSYMFSCGLQTIDARVNREYLNRAFHPDRYLSNLDRLMRAGQGVNVEIIYGLPGETLDGFKRTLDYVLSDLNARRFTAFHFLVIPGSAFREEAATYGLEYDPKPPYRLLSSPTWRPEDLAAATEWVMFLYTFM